LREHGIILRPLGDVVVIMPPLAMEVEQLQAICTALGQVIADLSERR
jgi:adenosylmethionine-8-amino-7-oxononanoate aminotransferase